MRKNHSSHGHRERNDLDNFTHLHERTGHTPPQKPHLSRSGGGQTSRAGPQQVAVELLTGISSRKKGTAGLCEPLVGGEELRVGGTTTD